MKPRKVRINQGIPKKGHEKSRGTKVRSREIEGYESKAGEFLDKSGNVRIGQDKS